jgi:hypothetical protein
MCACIGCCAGGRTAMTYAVRLLLITFISQRSRSQDVRTVQPTGKKQASSSCLTVRQKGLCRKKGLLAQDTISR